mmetsp:Transcript_9544/g.20491  ORF Transcript_9544/g.20491 Transcript_9544/m.20491 type:complete len:207 (+) Transcript_9544:143-763(+)
MGRQLATSRPSSPYNWIILPSRAFTTSSDPSCRPWRSKLSKSPSPALSAAIFSTIDVGDSSSSSLLTSASGLPLMNASGASASCGAFSTVDCGGGGGGGASAGMGGIGGTTAPPKSLLSVAVTTPVSVSKIDVAEVSLPVTSSLVLSRSSSRSSASLLWSASAPVPVPPELLPVKPSRSTSPSPSPPAAAAAGPPPSRSMRSSSSS